MQSRAGSFFESCVNTGIGLMVGLAAQVLVFPAVGLRVSWAQNWTILCAFTVISVVRGYFVRRLFNWWRR